MSSSSPSPTTSSSDCCHSDGCGPVSASLQTRWSAQTFESSQSLALSLSLPLSLSENPDGRLDGSHTTVSSPISVPSPPPPANMENARKTNMCRISPVSSQASHATYTPLSPPSPQSFTFDKEVYNPHFSHIPIPSSSISHARQHDHHILHNIHMPHDYARAAAVVAEHTQRHIERNAHVISSHDMQRGFYLARAPDARYLGFTPSRSRTTTTARPFLSAVPIIDAPQPEAACLSPFAACDAGGGGRRCGCIPVSPQVAWGLLAFIGLVAFFGLAVFAYLRKSHALEALDSVLRA